MNVYIICDMFHSTSAYYSNLSENTKSSTHNEPYENMIYICDRD